MGLFRVTIEVGDPPGQSFESIEALVDTGAFATLVPSSLLSRLGVRPAGRRTFSLADGRQIEREVAETRVRVDGRETTTWVIFGDEGSEPLLGAYTLEGLALAVDPVHRRLIPIPVLPLTSGARF